MQFIPSISAFAGDYVSKSPLMSLGFLRRSIFGANAVGLLQMAAYVGMVFILTNYLQQELGYSVLSADVVFLSGGLVVLVISGFLSARLVNRFGFKTPADGTIISISNSIRIWVCVFGSRTTYYNRNYHYSLHQRHRSEASVMDTTAATCLS